MQQANSGAITADNSRFRYKPLDYAREEIRLLILEEDDGNTEGLLSCSIGHFSIAPESHTIAFQEYYDSIDLDTITPKEFYETWQQTDNGSRYVWGDYSCVSYAWGSDVHDVKEILLNGQSLIIRSNLEGALRNLRMQQEFRGGLMLWIDAICINQEDIREKERVINQMQDIYIRASTVTIWLGQADETTEESIKTIQEFVRRYFSQVDTRKASHELDFPYIDSRWFVETVGPGLVHIIRRSYWTRLWIMQEITVGAPCRNIYIGPHCIPRNDVSLTMHYWLCRTRDLAYYCGLKKLGYSPSAVNSIEVSGVHLEGLMDFGDTYIKRKRLGKKNAMITATDSTYRVLESSRKCESTKAHDRVYGLRGLLSEKIASFIVPDYSKPVEEVYRDLAIAIIKGSRDLRFSLDGTLRPNSKQPSWAINTLTSNTRSPLFTRSGGILHWYDEYERIERLSDLIPCDVDLRWNTADSENLGQVTHCGFSHADSVLTIIATPVGAIDGLSGPLYDAYIASGLITLDIPQKQPTKPLRLHPDRDLRELFLRVMLPRSNRPTENLALFSIPREMIFGDRNAALSDELNKNGWLGLELVNEWRIRVLKRFWTERGLFSTWPGLRATDLFAEHVVPCDRVAVKKALTQVLALHDRCLFTTRDGRLGSTSVPVREDDRIYVAIGCDFPFLVRPDGDMHRVVGECFVDGYMNGEALDMVASGELAFERLHLR